MNEIINTLYSEVPVILNTLHFIRADWFYAFIPLFIFLLLSYKTTLDKKNWKSVIDPALLPFVLTSSNGKQRRYPLLLVFITASLCITALAGPVYKKSPQPVYREQSSLVVLLDLSQSMNISDVKPSRLSRAKLELLDLLKTRKTGQTALIVYAADAFVVTPLTDDNATIANLVPSLETEMMPAQGSNLTAALTKTFSLFTQAGIINGSILVITDEIKKRDENAIEKISSQGHSLSVFGIGTSDGGPIPLGETHNGGFLQDSNGAIVIAKLDRGKLQKNALSGSGLYTSLKADDSDIDKLAKLFESTELTKDTSKGDNPDNSKADDLNADIWQEEGHWLLLPLLFFAALWSRKGWLSALLPFTLILSLTTPQIAEAAPDSIFSSIDTNHLWSSPDQKAMKAFNAGDNEKAARQFSGENWKASAQYRNGNYEAVIDTLKKTDSSNGLYNKGNAFAKLGKYQDAISAYGQALELDKDNADAKYNLEQVEKFINKQEEDNKQNDDKNSGSENEDSDQQQSGQDQSEQDQSKDESSEEQSNDQSDNTDSPDKQQNNEESSSSKDKEKSQSAEEKELEKRDAEAEAEKQKQEQQQYQQDQKKKEPNEEDKNTQDKDEVEHSDSDKPPAEIEINPKEASITEEEKATQQWLKRIPDDPGGLLRRKFYYQYKQIPNQNDDNEPW